MAGPLASVGPAVVEQAVAGARPWWLVVAATGAGWLVVGPLLNHAIFRWIGWRVVLPLLLGRVPEQRELGRPRASCPRCGDPADILGLPVLPFAAAAGRCGSCGAGRYRWTAAVEAATGLAFGAAAATWGLSWTLLPVLVLIAGAVAMS